jgi:hypothetical protein
VVAPSLTSPLVTNEVPHALDRLYTLTSPDANDAPASRSIPSRIADVFLDIKAADQQHQISGEPLLFTDAFPVTPSHASIIDDDGPYGLASELDRLQSTLITDAQRTSSKQHLKNKHSNNNNNNLNDHMDATNEKDGSISDEWQPTAPSSPPLPAAIAAMVAISDSTSSTTKPLSVSSSTRSFPTPTNVHPSTSSSSLLSYASPTSSLSVDSRVSLSLSRSTHSLPSNVTPLTPPPSRPQSAVQLRSSSQSSIRSKSSSYKESSSSNNVTSSFRSPSISHESHIRGGRSPTTPPSITDINGHNKSPRFLQATASSARRISPTRVVSPPKGRNIASPASSLSTTPVVAPVAWSSSSSLSSPSQPIDSSSTLPDKRQQFTSAIPSPLALRYLFCSS